MAVASTLNTYFLNELVEYARTNPSLNPLLRSKGIKGGSTMQLEDRGVNKVL
jgi:hypothetical protein